MIEQVFRGGRLYWSWITFLVILIAIGGAAYYHQYQTGLTITGMSKEVSWGLYIANFTFLVGVAASAVIVVLPAYIYDYKKFKNITTIGEFLGASAVIMCILFIMVDLGRPDRVLNLVLNPRPNSVMFYDFIVLFGYLLLNIVIAWNVLSAKEKGKGYSTWLKILIFIAIPWAISIHTVTAFLYGGLVGRAFWNTALMAPRFLAGAFASGPSLLILSSLVLRKFTRFDPGLDAIRKIAEIATFAMITNLFMIGVELFTTYYAQHPLHLEHFNYLYFGIEEGGHVYNRLVPWIWTSLALGIIAVLMLIYPKVRREPRYLATASVLIFTSVWIDKGMGLIVPGYIPSQVGTVVEYWPSLPESLIALGVWAVGILVFTLLAKVGIAVILETSEPEPEEPEIVEEEAVEVEEEVVEEEKEYVCELCDAVFKNLDECCSHAEKEHKISKAACDMACAEVEE
jgi:molybdopterin-containing oxidoreductase family membrane subunit